MRVNRHCCVTEFIGLMCLDTYIFQFLRLLGITRRAPVTAQYVEYPVLVKSIYSPSCPLVTTAF